MLTDIFARRYEDVPIWKQFTAAESRLINQTFRIVSEQIFPYYVNGNESPAAKVDWKVIHDRLSMELGVKSLSDVAYFYQTTWNGKPHTVSGTWTINTVCENWMLKAFDGKEPVDEFIKNRLSFVEIAFRLQGDRIAEANAKLPESILAADLRASRISGPNSFRIPGKASDAVRAANAKLNTEFQSSVDELNTRFRQARAPLNYHNGFIQISNDTLLTDVIETPFWGAIADPKWKNVDIDMKEAFDRRDSGDRDPAFYAVRALESAVKIVSDEKGWTHGKERGAHNYIENLSSNGFIAKWEAEALKHVFTFVRNPLGHGPGTANMPTLTAGQTEWTIDISMSWIKRLARA